MALLNEEQFISHLLTEEKLSEFDGKLGKVRVKS